MTESIIPGSPPGVQPSSVRLGDLRPTVDVAQMREHLAALHEGVGDLTEIALCWTAPGCRWSHLWGPWPVFDVGFTEDPDYWPNWLSNGQQNWNLYTTVCAFKPHERESWRKHENVLQVPGTWADLDVKPGVEGHFQSRAEVDEFLEGLPRPTILVNSGSGGCHAYWLLPQSRRLAGGSKHVPELLDGWHAYLREAAGGVHVDKVQEKSRVLRVAGTVRWAKPAELTRTGVAWSPVELLWADGPRYALRDLLDLTHAPLERLRVTEMQHATQWRESRESSLRFLESLGLRRATQAYLEQLFNENQDWAPLLEGAGWTLASDNRSRMGSSSCRYWIRPGNAPNAHAAASTDYRGSNLLVFFSSEVNRFADLVIPGLSHGNNQGATTKYRFALITLYDGDESRLIRDIHSGRGRLA